MMSMKKLSMSVCFFVFFTIITCFFAYADIYYPHVASTSKWRTEICAINAGSGTVRGTFEAYDNNGNAVSDDIAVTLTPHARKEITVGTNFSDPSNIGYIIFKTDSKKVIGYTKFYINGQYRVAVPAIADITVGDFYISHIASTDKWWTGVSLVNTTSSNKNLVIEFDDGTTKNVSLDGYEHKAFSIKSLFDNTPQTDLDSAIIKNADGIVGLELFGSTYQLSGILLKNDTAINMYYPHIASDNKWWTGIVAYNPSTSPCTLTINPYTAEGTALTPRTVNLNGFEKYIGSAKTLGLPTNSEWFQIKATHPITGFELFGTNDSELLAGYTGVNISSKKGIFAKIEKDGWTGIAFVNITNTASDVELIAYDNAGTLVATESINLNPYAKTVDNPKNIFSVNIDNATYIAYSSSQELVGFQLNGSSDGIMLDGLPGLSFDFEPETKTNSLGMTFVYIEPGTFTMGSPSTEDGRDSDEIQHQVTLTQGYYLQTTEVTQGQWYEMMGTNPSFFYNCGDDCPVESVSWDDAQSFIEELNRMEGTDTYRLPTEAEWEYACRAGSTTAFANGDITKTDCSYDANLNAMGWYCHNSDVTYSGCYDASSLGGPTCAGTHPVALKQANAWGFYDMHGNVWEWCSDWYDSDPSGSVTDPDGASSGSHRMLRGGSWYYGARFFRSAYRGILYPAPRHSDNGFRVVISKCFKK